MKLLTYSRAHVLAALHAELLAAIPALRPSGGRAVMMLSGDGTTVEMLVPDAVVDAEVAAVIAAHDAAAAQAAANAAASADAADHTQVQTLRPSGAILTKLKTDVALTNAELQQVVRWLALAVWRMSR